MAAELLPPCAPFRCPSRLFLLLCNALQAERLLALATTSGKKDAATSSSKQAADSSKLLDETMAWAQEVSL